jgi:hypothetical protein
MDEETKKILEKLKAYDMDLYNKLVGAIPEPPQPAPEPVKEDQHKWVAGLNAGFKHQFNPDNVKLPEKSISENLAEGLAGMPRLGNEKVEFPPSSPSDFLKLGLAELGKKKGGKSG